MTLPAPRISGFLAPVRDAAASDAELLDRFVVHRDGPAFAALVTRHGPMVFGVCRRALRNWHTAEDAFQATFLVLARKAASIRPPGAVAGWLHGVAHRVAKDARRGELRRNSRERRTTELPEPAAPSGPDPELRTVLDEEIDKLPTKYRELLVACDLEERPRSLVAASLGIPEGTLSSRLTAARKMLARRLSKRGVAPAVTAGVAQNGPPVVASEVPRAVWASAARFGCGATGTVPVRVSSLAKGVVRMMFLTKLWGPPLVALAIGSVAWIALVTTASAGANPNPAMRLAAPAPALAPHGTDPAPPKTAPKLLSKGPNKLIFYRNGNLTLIDPDGKNAATVATYDPLTLPAGFVILSPNGTHCADLLDIRKRDDGPKQPVNLYVRKLDTKESWIDLGVNPGTFVWSPNGTEIACSEFDTGPLDKEQRSVTSFVVNIETKEKTALKLPNGHMITDWSRDGKHFLTTVESLTKDGPTARQYLMNNRDGSEHTPVGDAKTISGVGRLSPDGKRVLCYWSEGPDKEKKGALIKARLAVIDVATRKVTKVADTPLNGELHEYCWSPDGKRIAFTWREIHDGKPEDVINKETESHLIVCDPDGQNQKTVVTEKGQGQYHATISGLDWR